MAFSSVAGDAISRMFQEARKALDAENMAKLPTEEFLALGYAELAACHFVLWENHVNWKEKKALQESALDFIQKECDVTPTLAQASGQGLKCAAGIQEFLRDAETMMDMFVTSVESLHWHIAASSVKEELKKNHLNIVEEIRRKGDEGFSSLPILQRLLRQNEQAQAALAEATQTLTERFPHTPESLELPKRR
jgi:hypothetical protein